MGSRNSDLDSYEQASFKDYQAGKADAWKAHKERIKGTTRATHPGVEEESLASYKQADKNLWQEHNKRMEKAVPRREPDFAYRGPK